MFSPELVSLFKYQPIRIVIGMAGLAENLECMEKGIEKDKKLFTHAKLVGKVYIWNK